MVAAVENRPFESSTGQIDADIGARECERDRDRDRAAITVATASIPSCRKAEARRLEPKLLREGKTRSHDVGSLGGGTVNPLSKDER